MSKLLTRLAVATVAAVAAVAPAAQAAHHRHHPVRKTHRHAAARSSIRPGIYDCQGYNGTFFSYLGSYEFLKPGQYALSMLHKNHRLYGKIDHGRYQMQGNKVIPTSGPMKRDGFHMEKKGNSELLLELDNGQGIAVGCYWTKL